MSIINTHVNKFQAIEAAAPSRPQSVKIARNRLPTPPLMDPVTVFIVVTIVALLNGAVLGLMHRALARDVRQSAKDWRIGTLTVMGGSVLLAAQAAYPPGFILPLGNAVIFWGLALYWRSVRRFVGLADSPWIYAPAVLGVAGIFWFAAIQASFAGRVVVGSAGWLVPSVAGGYLLVTHSPVADKAGGLVSQRVLAGVFLAVAAFMAGRMVYFATVSQVPTHLLDGRNWINMVTPLAAAILPIVGTTAFLLMCSERLRRQWEQAAATDFLTALPNRRSIMGTGQSRFGAARRVGGSLAVAVIDVDHFKSVNDRFGHDVGDAALQHVATILARECRGADMAGRYGGEEFVVLFEGADQAAARAGAERLRGAIESALFDVTAPIFPNRQMTGQTITTAPDKSGQLVKITVSIGVAVITPLDSQFDGPLRRADQALLLAKAAGRNRVLMADAFTDNMADELANNA